MNNDSYKKKQKKEKNISQDGKDIFNRKNNVDVTIYKQ